MKQIIFLVTLVLIVGLFPSCEKNEDSEAAGIQGVWRLEISNNSYEYTKITENGIFIYDCCTSPELMYAKFKYSMNYTYDEKTKVISATMEGETDYIEVIDLTSSTLTLKNNQQYQTLSRVNTQKDFAPESIIGMTFGRSTDNYRFISKSTMEIIDTWNVVYFQTEILGEPSYSYTKTGKNTATLKMQYKTKSQIFDMGSEENLEFTLNLYFSIPTIGLIESGSYKSNGMNYNIVNGEWIEDEPFNRTVDCTAEDFILK